MIAAGIKELKNRLSYYLREVKKGEKILVTERGQVIAAILPVDGGEEDSKLLPLVKKLKNTFLEVLTPFILPQRSI